MKAQKTHISVRSRAVGIVYHILYLMVSESFIGCEECPDKKKERNADDHALNITLQARKFTQIKWILMTKGSNG